MNRSRNGLLACVALAACFAAPAHADIITVDAGAYAPGTDLTNAGAGVTIRMLSQDESVSTNFFTPLYSAAQSTACVAAACGDWGESLGFGGEPFPFGVNATASNGDNWFTCYQRSLSGLNSSQCGVTWQVLEVAFTDQVDWISIDSVWNIDPPSLVALDAAGNHVLNCHPWGPGNPEVAPGSPAGCLTHMTNAPGGTFTGTSTLNLEGLNATRVVFGSWAGFSAATSVTYSVSEPGVLGLMVLGLAGLAVVRTRRRQPVA